jgi:hypothetical protein
VPRRIGFALFLVAVTFLLVRAAQKIAWHEVWAALRAMDAATLAKAIALTAASFTLYTGFDLAARRYAEHHVPTPRVMAISFIAYAFSLNIGAVVGGAGFRFRMYGREGVPLGRIARVVVFCVATNWVGYLPLAGTLFASGAVVPPPDLALGGFATGTGLRVVGVVMLAATLAYLIACRATHGRVFHLRGPPLPLPTLRLALLADRDGRDELDPDGRHRRVLPPPNGGCDGARHAAHRRHHHCARAHPRRPWRGGNRIHRDARPHHARAATDRRAARVSRVLLPRALARRLPHVRRAGGPRPPCTCRSVALR